MTLVIMSWWELECLRLCVSPWSTAVPCTGGKEFQGCPHRDRPVPSSKGSQSGSGLHLALEKPGSTVSLLSRKGRDERTFRAQLMPRCPRDHAGFYHHFVDSELATGQASGQHQEAPRPTSNGSEWARHPAQQHQRACHPCGDWR